MTGEPKTIRERSRAAKGQATPKEKAPLQITLLGHDVVLNPLDLVPTEKQRWRAYLAELGPHADEADHMLALTTVLIQRTDPEFSWETAKNTITWETMLDAVKNGKPAEASHPQ